VLGAAGVKATGLSKKTAVVIGGMSIALKRTDLIPAVLPPKIIPKKTSLVSSSSSTMIFDMSVLATSSIINNSNSSININSNSVKFNNTNNINNNTNNINNNTNNININTNNNTNNAINTNINNINNIINYTGGGGSNSRRSSINVPQKSIRKSIDTQQSKDGTGIGNINITDSENMSPR
jgi:hypothetical protein